MLTSRDFQEIMAVIIATYPNSKLDLTNELQMSIWFDNLCDLEPTKCKLALKSLLATSEFAPTIAAIRKKYAQMSMPEQVDNEEAWGMVMKAIAYYGYMRADEAMASLPAQVQRAVTWVGGFKIICESEKVDVIRGQFNAAMASVNRRTETNAAMGQNLVGQINQYKLLEEQMQKLPSKYIEENRLDIREREQSQENLDMMQTVREVMQRVCGTR